MVVFAVVGHISTICFSHILSLTCMEYLSCKCGGKTLYISSTTLIASNKKINSC